MGPFDLHTPILGWWLVAPGLLIGACVFCRIRWHWSISSILAVLSVIVATIAGAMLPLSRGTFYDIGLTWNFPQPGGEYHCWFCYIVSENDGIQLCLRMAEAPHPGEEEIGLPEVHIRRCAVGASRFGHYPIWDRTYSITPSDFVERTLGFQFCWATFSTDPSRLKEEGAGPVNLRVYSATAPHWFVMLLPLPFIWLALGHYRRRRYRHRHGLCVNCGYDLRVQKSGQAGAKCPECGTPIAQKPAPTRAPSARSGDVT